MRTRLSIRNIRRADRSAPRGFTLIELMVVIGIIGLLVAIAVPALSAARTAAKRAASEATMSTLGTGLEMFHQDTAIGGSYPPSARPANTPNGRFAADPYDTAGNKTVDVGGATLLVWALAGADLQGSPGFRNLDNDALNDGFGGWLSDTHRAIKNNIPGLYALDANGKALAPRAKAYVDLSKVKMAKQTGNSSDFDIPSAPSALGAQRQGQVFLDNFDQPILYYKANPNAPAFVASGGRGINPAGTAYGTGNLDQYNVLASGTTQRYVPTGVYNLLDNSIFTGIASKTGVGIDMGAGNTHPIRELGTVTSGEMTPRGSFGFHMRNPNVKSALQTQREDSFILLSAGNDGLFGTADDIANFPINK